VTIAGTREALSIEAAVDVFLSSADLSRTSVRVYRQALGQLARELPADGTLEQLEAEHLEHAAIRAWGHLGPATWNRNLAVVGSFVRWQSLDVPARLTPHLRRRREPADRTRAVPWPVLERLFMRETVPLREKTLWRLLYETASRASEILALDVEDLDLPNKRARIRSKGGDLELVYFQSGAARLLPRLLGGRTRGPVFLTSRSAPAGTPSLDICPVTGRARLSYRRAAALFARHTDGVTLHQLRHSALTHLAESGESTVLLMAKSRHRSLRSLQRYARPGPEAVAALTARHDPPAGAGDRSAFASLARSAYRCLEDYARRMLRLHPLRVPNELPAPPTKRCRRVSPERLEWARYCDQVLVEHGAVRGSLAYPERYQARWKGRSLMSLLVQLGARDRSELRGHTDRVRGGWVWTVEYLGAAARGPTRRD
jgi:integrase/recombinase XerC/integrase/recombinase XerD